MTTPPDLPVMMGNSSATTPSLQNASYYPGGPPSNEITGGLPINLDSLRDGPPGSKPFYPYSTLIRYAIKGSPHQKLLLEDIYYAIEMRFPYFRTAPSGWKNSVRHNLSLNPCFEKVPRPLTDRGKGSYWTVNDNVDPRTGVHRVRKRRAGNKNSQKTDDAAAYTPNNGYGEERQTTPTQQQQIPQPGGVNFGAQGRYPPPVVPMQHPDGAGPSRMPFPYPFDAPPFLGPSGMRYEPREADPNLEGVDWRSMWLGELDRLQAITTQQEKSGAADPEWYRIMFGRLRAAFPDPNPHPPLASHEHPHLAHEHGHLGHDQSNEQ